MFGADYPFEIGDALGRYALPSAERDAILGGNAAAALARAGVTLPRA